MKNYDENEVRTAMVFSFEEFEVILKHSQIEVTYDNDGLDYFGPYSNGWGILEHKEVISILSEYFDVNVVRIFAIENYNHNCDVWVQFVEGK